MAVRRDVWTLAFARVTIVLDLCDALDSCRTLQ